MSITVIRPDGTRSGASNFTINGGAASTHAAVSDSSDSTWLRKSSSGTASIIFNCGTFSLGSGQAIKQVRLAARVQTTETDSKANIQLGVRKNGINYFGPAFQVRGVDALATYNAPYYPSAPNGEAWTQALLNQIMVQVTDYRDGAARLFLYEISVDVDTVTAPTTTVSSPSGTVTTTSRPDVAWSVTDVDGEAQAYYQIKVFTAAQYGVVGFDPTSATATWDSGQIGSADSSASIGAYLANSTTYRAYVRTGKTLNGAPFWSDWAFSQFTISLTPPTTPTVTASFESASNRVLVTATGAAPTGYDRQIFAVERSADGGTTWTAVRDASDLIPNTTHVAQVYDYEAPRGGSVSYRARAIGVLADNEVASPWGGRRNLVTNPSFEVDLTGWQFAANGFARVTTNSLFGTACARVTFSSTTDSNIAFTSTNATTTGAHVFSLYVYIPPASPLAGRTVELSVEGGTAVTGNPSVSTPATLVAGSWVRAVLTRNVTTPGNMVWVVRLSGLLSSAVGHVLDLDGALVEQGSSVQTYFDGDSANSSWNGTAHASTSNAPLPVTITSDGTWWWKALTAPTINRGAIPVLTDPNESLKEDLGLFTPIGRSTPVVISGGLSGREGAYSLVISGVSAWTSFEPLLRHTGTLLVQTPFGDQRYIRITDRAITLTGTTGAPRREVEVKYVEVSGD